MELLLCLLRDWWDTVTLVLNIFHTQAFGVELQGLHGICSCPGKDPEPIAEAGSDCRQDTGGRSPGLR